MSILRQDKNTIMKDLRGRKISLAKLEPEWLNDREIILSGLIDGTSSLKVVPLQCIDLMFSLVNNK